MNRIPGINIISDFILPYYVPTLRKKMKSVGLKEPPELYVDKAVLNGLVWSGLIAFIVAIIAWVMTLVVTALGLILAFFVTWIILAVPLIYVNLKRIDIMETRLKKAIEYDLVFAVKHLVIALSSGTSLFDALVSVTKGYGQVSREFKEIVERVALGEPLTAVLRDKADKTPSSAFKRVLIQIANAEVSGADIAEALDAVANQISQEELLEVKEYGQTLNPIVMFYLIIGVILPSLGVAFFIILLSFVSKGIKLPFIHLVGIAVVIGLIQFLFLAFIESTRPKYAIMA